MCLLFAQAKLGGQGTISSMIWAPDGVLATCSTEPHIRFTIVYIIK